jgi:hypothetical protein
MASAVDAERKDSLTKPTSLTAPVNVELEIDRLLAEKCNEVEIESVCRQHTHTQFNDFRQVDRLRGLVLVRCETHAVTDGTATTPHASLRLSIQLHSSAPPIVQIVNCTSLSPSSCVALVKVSACMYKRVRAHT